MTKLKITFLTLAITFSITLHAQKKLKQEVELLKGSLSQLKGQPNLNIAFKYDDMLVGTVREQQFIDTKKSNWEQKELGKGVAFEKHWFDSRVALHESMFRYQFSKAAAIAVGDTTSTYTLTIQIQEMEPGWNAGAVTHRPSIAGTAMLTSATNNTPIAVIQFSTEGADFKGGDFEMGRRLQSAYFAAAKLLGDFVKEDM